MRTEARQTSFEFQLPTPALRNDAGDANAMLHLLSKFEAEILRLKWLTAISNLEAAVRRYALAQRKANFNPLQPRVPAGNPDGGQWTHEGGDDASLRLTLAGLKLPRVPQKKPPTAQERNRTARELAREGGQESLAAAIGAGATWLYEKAAEFYASFDGPKSLQELQDAASNPRPGYDIHHNVEKALALEDGFPKDIVDGPDKKVLIPRWKHWDINAWYQTKSEDFGGLSPREYLRGKNWEERVRIGHYALRKFGVLKP
jgi:hypothetical protein